MYSKDQQALAIQGGCLPPSSGVIMTTLRISALLLTLLYLLTGNASLEFDDSIVIVDGCEIVPKTHCENADLSGANLRNADLSGATFINVTFNETDLRHANLSFATFKRSKLDHANLAMANMYHADLRSSTVLNANRI